MEDTFSLSLKTKYSMSLSNVFSSLSHRLSIFAVLNQTEKSFGYFTIMLKGEGLF